jgi:hypothetical protein
MTRLTSLNSRHRVQGSTIHPIQLSLLRGRETKTVRKAWEGQNAGDITTSKSQVPGQDTTESGKRDLSWEKQALLISSRLPNVMSFLRWSRLMTCRVLASTLQKLSQSSQSLNLRLNASRHLAQIFATCALCIKRVRVPARVSTLQKARSKSRKRIVRTQGLSQKHRGRSSYPHQMKKCPALANTRSISTKA